MIGIIAIFFLTCWGTHNWKFFDSLNGNRSKVTTSASITAALTRAPVQNTSRRHMVLDAIAATSCHCALCADLAKHGTVAPEKFRMPPSTGRRPQPQCAALPRNISAPCGTSRLSNCRRNKNNATKITLIGTSVR